MSDPLRVLIGSSLHLIENEEDDDRDIETESNFSYICLEILNNIGKESFKSTYMNLEPDLLNYNIEQHLPLWRDVLVKIEEVYKVHFDNVMVESEEDCKKIWELLLFLEYNHLDFLVDLFSYFEEDPMTIKDTKQWIEINKEKIDRYINTICRQTGLVLEFLKICNWVEFREYLNKIVERNRVEVSIELKLKPKGE